MPLSMTTLKTDSLLIISIYSTITYLQTKKKICFQNSFNVKLTDHSPFEKYPSQGNPYTLPHTSPPFLPSRLCIEISHRNLFLLLKLRQDLQPLCRNRKCHRDAYHACAHHIPLHRTGFRLPPESASTSSICTS